jgi:polysaccharide deacetylase family protein (PEP-CTERM system associated)
MSVCFTFDIEEHDRIESAVGLSCPPDARREYARRMEASTRWILEVLADHKARATFFILGHIAETHPQLVRDIAAGGHEVGCHSWDHRRVHQFDPDGFRADIRRAREALEDAAGEPVVGFRAPTFSVMRETAWAIDVLAEEGFRYDSSIFPVRHDRYGVPDAPRFPFVVRGRERTLLELPPATLALGGFNVPAGGGGYFRLFPLGILRMGVWQAERQPAGIPVLYFHPWEFDPEQPRLPLGWARRFRTYVGISKTRSRLQRLLARYPSARMIDAVEELEAKRAELATFRLAPETAFAPGHVFPAP